MFVSFIFLNNFLLVREHTVRMETKMEETQQQSKNGETSKPISQEPLTEGREVREVESKKTTEEVKTEITEVTPKEKVFAFAHKQTVTEFFCLNNYKGEFQEKNGHALLILPEGEYHVRFLNQSSVDGDLIVHIDDKWIGQFRVGPGKDYIIKRPTNEDAAFEFRKEKSSSAQANGVVIGKKTNGLYKGVWRPRKPYFHNLASGHVACVQHVETTGPVHQSQRVGEKEIDTLPCLSDKSGGQKVGDITMDENPSSLNKSGAEGKNGPVGQCWMMTLQPKKTETETQSNETKKCKNTTTEQCEDEDENAA